MPFRRSRTGRDLRALAQQRQPAISFAPSRQYGESTDSFAPSRKEAPPPEFKGSFSRGLAHFGSWAERLTKRQAALVGMAGTIGVLFASGFAYWTAHQGFAKETALEQMRAEQRRQDLEIRILQTTIAGYAEHFKTLDDRAYHQGEDIASLKTPKGKK